MICICWKSLGLEIWIQMSAATSDQVQLMANPVLFLSDLAAPV